MGSSVQVGRQSSISWRQNTQVFCQGKWGSSETEHLGILKKFFTRPPPPISWQKTQVFWRFWTLVCTTKTKELHFNIWNPQMFCQEPGGGGVSVQVGRQSLNFKVLFPGDRTSRYSVKRSGEVFCPSWEAQSKFRSSISWRQNTQVFCQEMEGLLKQNTWMFWKKFQKTPTPVSWQNTRVKFGI